MDLNDERDEQMQDTIRRLKDELKILLGVIREFIHAGSQQQEESWAEHYWIRMADLVENLETAREEEEAASQPNRCERCRTIISFGPGHKRVLCISCIRKLSKESIRS